MSNEENTPTAADGQDETAAAAAHPPEASDAQDAGSPNTSPNTSQGADDAAEERDRLKQQLMRTAADFENFRRRSKREVEEARMKGKDDAVLELLPVFDNLERAVQASEGATDVAAVIEGVQMVLRLFEDTAQRMGLNRVKSVGERFDPAVHDAIQQQETADHPPGSIVAEVGAGYMFGKRLIRPAMVVVARAPKPEAVADPPAEQAADGAGADTSSSETGADE